MKRRSGRLPGQPRKMTCAGCGCVELTMGGWPYRCARCGPADIERGLGKDTAARELRLAIRDGRVPHWRGMSCVDCGAAAIGYEHRDYNKPLCVEPICGRCNILRGPAIPRVGAIARLVARGAAPYRSGRHVRQLAKYMGVTLPDIPARIGHAEWLTLAPMFAAPPTPETQAAQVAP